jgi:hypothetical protein
MCPCLVHHTVVHTYCVLISPPITHDTNSCHALTWQIFIFFLTSRDPCLLHRETLVSCPRCKTKMTWHGSLVTPLIFFRFSWHENFHKILFIRSLYMEILEKLFIHTYIYQTRAISVNVTRTCSGLCCILLLYNSSPPAPTPSPHAHPHPRP